MSTIIRFICSHTTLRVEALKMKSVLAYRFVSMKQDKAEFLPICQYEAGQGRARAGPSEVRRAAEVSLEVRDPVVRGKLEDQPFPLHRGLVRHQQHLAMIWM